MPLQKFSHGPKNAKMAIYFVYVLLCNGFWDRCCYPHLEKPPPMFTNSEKTTWDQYIAFNRSNNYGFTTNLLDSRCMCSRIHNGFFDSRHKFFGSSGFWDSRCFRGFTMRSGIHDGLVLLLHGRCNRGVQMLVF